MLLGRHTIRNLDSELLLEARIHAIQNHETLGAVINRAIELYLDDSYEEDCEEAAYDAEC